MRSDSGTGKSASVKTALVGELYNLLFHGSTLEVHQTGDYLFGYLVMGESG
jgi:hypothetical protein